MAAVPPGHSVPPGTHAGQEGDVAAWCNSFGGAFASRLAELNVAERLVYAGYVDLYTLSFSVADLVELEQTEAEEEPLPTAMAARCAQVQRNHYS